MLAGKRVLVRVDFNVPQVRTLRQNSMVAWHVPSSVGRGRVRVVSLVLSLTCPQDKTTGEITDTTRIQEALPTIKHLQGAGSRVILCSHLGRPKGEKVEKFTLKPVSCAPAVRHCAAATARLHGAELDESLLLLCYRWQRSSARSWVRTSHSLPTALDQRCVLLWASRVQQLR